MYWELFLPSRIVFSLTLTPPPGFWPHFLHLIPFFPPDVSCIVNNIKGQRKINNLNAPQHVNGYETSSCRKWCSNLKE